MRQLHIPQQPIQRRRNWKRLFGRLVLSLVVLFVLTNGLLWAMYRNRVLPNYTLGSKAVGGMQYDDITQQLSKNTFLPTTLVLSTAGKQQSLSTKQLGVALDAPKTVQRLRASQVWLPALSLVTKHQVPLNIAIDTQDFQTGTAAAMQHFAVPPIPNHVEFTGTAFAVAPASSGRQVEAAAMQRAVQVALQQGRQTVQVPTRVVPTPPDEDLTGEVNRLQKQLKATIQFVYAGKAQKIDTKELGAWYVPENRSLKPSAERITAQVERIAKGFGITPYNAADAATASLYALNNAGALNFRLVANQNTARYYYCVGQRGLNANVLEELRLKLAATYGDSRGWNNEGGIAFVYGQEQQCDFTVWLSAASQMPSFGDICDTVYSCRVAENVVINYDRWRLGTDPWNKAGLGLEDYRVLAINHETGHWLGFGHLSCTGAGNPAPVMMQQSIDLGGCKFNPWPTEPELTTL